MAILINVLQDKRRASNHLWYGRAVQPYTIDTQMLAERIQRNVSVKESDVYAVLIELAEVMAYELSNGNKVQLDRFGYFWYGAKTTGALTADEWTVPDNFKKAKINFVLFNKRNSAGKVISKALGGNDVTAQLYMVNNVLKSSIKNEDGGEGE